MPRELFLLPGRSFPLGATVYGDTVNFCVFSQTSYAVELLLFDQPDDVTPTHTIRLDPRINRTFYYWHIFVGGIAPQQLYAYRVHGPFDPAAGHRFDGRKLLLDPYGRCVAIGKNYDRSSAQKPGDNSAYAMKSVVVDTSLYDWEGDFPLRYTLGESIIYEMHVGGFTKHESSGVRPNLRGTYAGLIQKIQHLKDLGVTAVELLPVQQFDEGDAPPPLRNYWGYSPIAFFAPHRGYSSDQSATGPVTEFRDMVKALHRAGLEVILDVVFNHTAEGGPDGPTFSFRGFENRAYYTLDRADAARFMNYSGCGNTVNANHYIVRRMIMDCLRYWVSEMHVDAFRFDLASVLARDESGNPLQNPPILWEIESDPVLAGTRIIAEAWDAAGLYQLGSFVGFRWAEWNGRFRDDVRRFLRGDNNTVTEIASRICGNPDLFPEPERDVGRSVNFVTCHDGFTLCDLVSYDRKHNEANGWDNRDGADENFSWNCGVEGPSDAPDIVRIRRRQMRNFLTILFTSQGTPMILMGDEGARTQGGNNNAYNQDNPTSWLSWTLFQKNADLVAFVRRLIEIRRTNPYVRIARPWLAEYNGLRVASLCGVDGRDPDLRSFSHSLGCTLRDPSSSESWHLLFNACEEDLEFYLPPGEWEMVIDTARDDKLAILGAAFRQSTCVTRSRSIVILRTQTQLT